MFAILVALAVLAAGVAAIYLILKSMSEEGIDIAAPGGCKRSRCGGPTPRQAEPAEDATLQIADRGDRDKVNF